MANKKEAHVEKTKKAKRTATVKMQASEDVTEEKSWTTKMGRPRKFDPDYAIQIMEEEIEKYLQSRGKEGAYWETLPGNSEGAIVYKPKPFTTVGAIALMCGVDIGTFLDHVNARNEDGSLKNEHLHQSYKAFKDLGQVRLLEGGAAQAYSPNYVSFVGNVNYGMVPKQQVESKVEIKSMDKVYAELDTILASGQEENRISEQKAEMEARKALLDEEELEDEIDSDE